MEKAIIANALRQYLVDHHGGDTDATDPDKNHKAAAQALATKLSWAGHWTSGGGDHGAYVWVRTTIGAGGDDFHVRAEDCLA